MTTLFTIGLLLIAAFGFAVGAYLAFYTFKFNSLMAKSVVTLVLGAITTLVTFTISLIIVWPGV